MAGSTISIVRLSIMNATPSVVTNKLMPNNIVPRRTDLGVPLAKNLEKRARIVVASVLTKSLFVCGSATRRRRQYRMRNDDVEGSDDKSNDIFSLRYLNSGSGRGSILGLSTFSFVLMFALTFDRYISSFFKYDSSDSHSEASVGVGVKTFFNLGRMDVRLD